MATEEPLSEDSMPDMFAYLNYNDEQLELLFNTTFTNSNDSMGNMGLDMVDTDHLINSIFSFVDKNIHQDSPTVMTCTLILLYTASFVCGLVGNFMAFSVVFRCRRLNQTTIVLLFSLLFSDLLVVTVCLPSTMVNYVNGAWIHGKVVCKLLPFIQGVAIFSGMFVLFVLVAQQFLDTARWCALRRVFSSYGTALVVLLSWACAVLLSSPLLVVTELRVLQLMGVVTVTMCQEVWPHTHSRHLFNVFVFLLTYVIPGAACGVGYVTMTCNRRRTQERQDEMSMRVEDLGNDQHQAAERVGLNNHVEESPKDDTAMLQALTGRINAQRLLKWLIGMFAVLWLPYHIVIIYLDVHAEKDRMSSLATNVLPIVQWLSLSTSAFRPVCYCLLGTDFRSQVHRGCCCLCGTDTIDCDTDTGLFAQRRQGAHYPDRDNSQVEELDTNAEETQVRDCITVV